jgi:hypothetical protein
MRRRIHLGIGVLTLVAVGACSRAQDPPSTPQRTLAPVQVTLTAQGQEQADTLLEVVPPGARNLARLKVADAASQPLFQAFLNELRQNPQLAQRNQQITQRCGENPLQSIEEVAFFNPEGAGGQGTGTQGAGTQGAGTQGAGTQGAGTQGAGTQGTGTQGAGTQGAQRGTEPGLQQRGQSGVQQQGGAQSRGAQGQARQGTGEQPGAQQMQGRQGSAMQGAQSAQLLVQLNRPTSWAFQCLSAMRNDVSQAQVGGRTARSIGQFMVIDAGNNRLLVTRRQGAPAALQRLIQAEQTDTGQTHQAAQRVESLGDPLLFSTGAFANRMGLQSTEAVMTEEGDGLQLQMTGKMSNAEAAQNAARRLETGLNLLAAVLGSQVNQQQGAQGESMGGATRPPTSGEPGATAQGGAAQEDPQEILRSVVEGVRIESRGDTVRLAVNLPDAETQRFVGGVLARFLADGGVQRLMEQRPQRQQQQQQGRSGGAAGGG